MQRQTERYILLPGDAGYTQRHADPDWYPDDEGEVNRLSLPDVDAVVGAWLASGTIVIEEGSGRWRCDLAPNGPGGHPQATVPVYLRAQLSYDPEDTPQWKLLVHQVVWRHRSRFPLPVNQARDSALALPLSHTARDSRYLEFIAESPELNESRKYCHLFRWYLDGRCPHVYKPCTE